MAKRYGFDDKVAKHQILRKARLNRLKDWGAAINAVSNGVISEDAGNFIARVMNVGTIQSRWVPNKNNLIALCKQIVKQDKFNSRLRDFFDDMNNLYGNAARKVYFEHKTHKQAAEELGVDVTDMQYILDAFLYAISFSEFYPWIVEGRAVQTSRELLIEMPELKPSTVMRLGRMSIVYVEEIQGVLRTAKTVEEGMTILSKHCGSPKRILREMVEDLSNNSIVELINLKGAEIHDNHKYDENKPYAILSKNVFIDGRMTVEDYIIRILTLEQRSLKKALDELVFNDTAKRLDIVRLHNNDFLGRPIYQIVCSKINWDT